jgi:hypothetical protein
VGVVTTREELEAIIRRELTGVAAVALASDDLDVVTGRMNAAVDTILPAADTYRRARPNPEPGPADIAGTARELLTWTGRTVHWQAPGRTPNTAICHGRVTRAMVTSQRDLVTCGTCTQSRAWQAGTPDGRSLAGAVL